jgi:DNA-binding response OmpR family regulator
MARILIVDDDPSIRELIQDILSAQDHTFDQAGSGSEALKKIRGGRFDLVILDRSMPEMDGIQFLKQLRAMPAPAGLKVLMCTAAEKMSDVSDAFQSGATDYIVKPLDFAKLSMKVARLTAKG